MRNKPGMAVIEDMPSDMEDLEIYACPRCKGVLHAIAPGLECTPCGRVYEVRGEVPCFLLADPAYSTHPVLRKVRAIDWLARIYETRLWYPLVLRLATGKEPATLPQLTALVQQMTGPVTGCVLDVACGPGTFGRRVAGQARRVYGIDISMGMLEQGLLLAKREHVTNILFAQAQVEALPFRNEAFDAGICSGSLHLFADTIAALREIGRTLKSGAPLAILTLTAGTSGLLRFRPFLEYGRKRGLRVFDAAELQLMLQKAGFEDANHKTFGCVLTFRAVKK
jgi:ubiquinone/menaquinone biosynthesis C-methylase UbiE/uncharacterized protein YbaR (Trm112 family)